MVSGAYTLLLLVEPQGWIPKQISADANIVDCAPGLVQECPGGIRIDRLGDGGFALRPSAPARLHFHEGPQGLKLLSAIRNWLSEIHVCAAICVRNT